MRRHPGGRPEPTSRPHDFEQKIGRGGLLVSVDQGNAQIPVSSITQKGTKLTLTVNAVGGGFEGEISADGMQLTGTWTQLGNSLPLNLKKAAADTKP
jgi:hypothetical protein